LARFGSRAIVSCVLRTLGASVAAIALLAAATPARGQTTVAVVGGLTATPTQGFGGVGFDLTARAPHADITFHPTVEIATGSGSTTFIADIAFAYWATLTKTWHVYLGGGPTFLYLHGGGGNCGTAACGGFSGADGTLTGFVGFQNDRGLRFEVDASGGANASLFLTVGYVIKRKP
jgi:hypothetical protein